MVLSSYGFPIERRGLEAEQLARVRVFKQQLQQASAWNERYFDEHDCARFLKARNYDLQAAKQMWDSMLAWRRENRVDTISDWFTFHERKEYDAVFPTGLHKTDKEGHPVLIQQLGRVNIGALYKVTTDDRIRLAHIAENEHLRRAVFPSCSRAAGRPIDQLFTIIDLEGVAFTSMMRTTSLLKMFMAMDSNNYPETLAHMAIINAPSWFSTSWGAVKSVLSGDTVRKIEILGKDYKAALLRHIAPENLLTEYGGTSVGRITANFGPWLEPLLEPPAPTPVSPLVTAVSMEIGVRVVMETDGELPGSGGSAADQRTQRDVASRRTQSPVRPGAKAAAGTVASGHPAPPASPPLAKRPHHDEALAQPRMASAGQQSGCSPVSVSDSSSEMSQNMSAPLMSNFLSSADSPVHHTAAAITAQGRVGSPPLGAGNAAAVRRGGSSGGAAGIVSGLVSGFQVAVAHVGHHHPHQAGAATSAVAADGGVLHPPPGPTSSPLTSRSALPAQQQPRGASGRMSWGGSGAPAHLQLASPREDTAGPCTLLSTASVVYTPPSAMSPISPSGDMQAASDTATSRPVDGVLKMTAVAAQTSGVSAPGASNGAFAIRPTGPSAGSEVVSGSHTAGVPGAGEVLPMASMQQQQPPAHQLQQQDTDDSESVRISVMSQRSFYSALSHVEYSSSSGFTSPNEASETARRNYTIQRELHAAAIASALAATAEQRRAAASAIALSQAATGRATGGGAASVSTPTVMATGAGTGGATSPPTSAGMGAVSFFVPPASQQAFGFYLDQPPPYGSFSNAAGGPVLELEEHRVASHTSAAGVHGGKDEAHHPGSEFHRKQASSQGGDAVIYVHGPAEGNMGGMCRSPSAATIDDCSLGAGAVRWARGWFFRRRTYGRLVESDGVADGSGMGSGGGAGDGARPGSVMLSRKGMNGGSYANMQDGLNATSPSKLLPKGQAAVHHARGDSWEWDQPSPYDIDQTYGRGVGIMQRDAPFGRGAERRRLLRSESPSRRRGLEDYCSCVPCCTVM